MTPRPLITPGLLTSPGAAMWTGGSAVTSTWTSVSRPRGRSADPGSRRGESTRDHMFCGRENVCRKCESVPVTTCADETQTVCIDVPVTKVDKLTREEEDQACVTSTREECEAKQVVTCGPTELKQCVSIPTRECDKVNIITKLVPSQTDLGYLRSPWPRPRGWSAPLSTLRSVSRSQ